MSWFCATMSLFVVASSQLETFYWVVLNIFWFTSESCNLYIGPFIEQATVTSVGHSVKLCSYFREFNLCSPGLQVTNFQGQVKSGDKPADSDMLAVSEMLMRQLLKLDGIEADGDAKALRRTEVCWTWLILSTTSSFSCVGVCAVVLVWTLDLMSTC